MFFHEYKSIFIGMFRIKVWESSLPAEIIEDDTPLISCVLSGDLLLRY